jgi:hypothetical protein
MSIVERFPHVANGGETVSFYSCCTCGASVQPDERERHDDWHRKLEAFPKSSIDPDLF